MNNKKYLEKYLYIVFCNVVHNYTVDSTKLKCHVTNCKIYQICSNFAI